MFLEGDPPDAVYFLAKGELAFVTRQAEGPDLIYASLKEGEVLGDTDLLPLQGEMPAVRGFSAKALSEAELLMLPK